VPFRIGGTGAPHAGSAFQPVDPATSNERAMSRHASISQAGLHVIPTKKGHDMNRKPLAFQLVFLFLFLQFSPFPPVAEGKPLTVAFTEWFPYTYLDRGKPAGFEIEVLRSVLDEMGVKAVFSQYPWKRCLQNLKNGRSDALVSMLKAPDRELYTFYPVEPISISRTVFFIPAGKNIRYDGSLKRLRNYSIGVIGGFSYGKAFDEADFLIRDTALDARMLITKLLRGRIDMAAENKLVITGTAIRMGVLDQIRFLEPPIHTQELYVGFSRAGELETFSRSFSQALKHFKHTPHYRRILSRYGLNPMDMRHMSR
jgi:polar amino acid transport system substrate-binding protein